MRSKHHFLTRIYNNRWLQVFLGFIVFIGLGTVYSYGILRIEIQNVFDVGSTLSGLPYLTSLAFYSLTMLVSGRYLVKYSPAKIMVIGSILVSLGWILSGLVTTILGLVMTYGVIMGTGVGLVYGVPIAIMPKWFSKGRGLAVGLVLAGFGLSPLVTSPITQLAIDNFGLKGTFITFGVIFVIFLPLLSLVFHYPESNEANNIIASTDKGNKEMINIMKTRNFWLLYINFIIGTTVGLMIIGTSGIIGSNYYNIEIHIIALTVSFFAICNSIGRPVFGALNDIIGTKNTIAVIHIITIISSSIIIFQPLNDFMNYFLGLSLAWMMLGAWLAVAPAATHNLFAEENYSKNYGIIFTGYGIGAIIGVLFSGRIIDANLSIGFIFVPVIVISFIALVITKIYLKTSHEKKVSVKSSVPRIKRIMIV